MTRDEQIEKLLPMAKSFARCKSRGSAALEEEIYSLLCEVLVRRLEHGDIKDIDRYFQRTFNLESLGFYERKNTVEKQDRTVLNNLENDHYQYNDALTTLYTEDIMSLLNDDEKKLISLRLDGATDKEIRDEFSISGNRLKAVLFKLEKQLRGELCD